MASRTLTMDSASQTLLEKLLGKKRENFGLIVGQLTSDGDYASFLAPTLPPQEDKVDVEAEEALELETEAPPKKTADGVVLKELTNGWVTHHANQLGRLLTGGLDVIGLFVVCDPDVLVATTPKLKTFYGLLEKQRKKRVARHRAAGRAEPRPHRYMVHCCKRSGKISCKCIDVGDATDGFHPAELKIQDFLESWSRIDCGFGLDSTIDIPVEKLSKLSLMKQIQHGLAPTLKELWEAKVILTPASSAAGTASALPDARAPLNEEAAKETKAPRGGRKGGRKGQGDAPVDTNVGRRFVATILKPTLVGGDEEEEEVSRTECATQMVIRGTVCARAHVHAKASVEVRGRVSR